MSEPCEFWPGCLSPIEGGRTDCPAEIRDAERYDEDDEFYDDCDQGDECYHENADIDILIGRALCLSCGHAWWMTDKEIEAEAKFQAEYFEAMAAEAESPPA